MDKIIGILVVDDDESIRGVVEETLSDGGFEPALAASGEEALSLLKANKYRALVVDISFGNDRIKGWDVGSACSSCRSLSSGHLYHGR
jgi:DNA-binding response OmpR family regulator